MAKIHYKRNQLKISTQKYLKRVIMLYSMIPLYSTGLIYFKLKFSVLHVLFLLITLIFASSSYKRYATLKAGLRGEKKAISVLQELPDNYHIFNNIQIKYNGRLNEIDVLIVSEKGIFIVEVKNHNGIIVGNKNEQYWLQHKTGKKGGKYSKNIKNPIKQVNGQVFNLSKNLKKKGFNVWIQGIVCFANDEAKLDVKSTDIPVLKLEKELLNYIRKFKPRNTLDEKTIMKITKWVMYQNDISYAA